MGINKKRTRGFTIVELLIVIVVIGVLAAITVVAYRGVQNRAHDSVVESDIVAIQKKLALARIDLDHYPESNTEMPSDFKLNKSAYDTTQNNIYYCLDKANQRYALGLRSASLRGYIITDDTLHNDVIVNGSETCKRIGYVGWSDASYTLQGYTSATKVWSGYWKWTS